jgi:NAD+ kinase
MLDAATQAHLALQGLPGHPLDAIGRSADVAVVLGGDGTMLGIARELAPYGVPLIGINHGRLGFMTDIALDQAADVLSSMLAGHYESDRRSMLDAEVLRDGQVRFATRALNDVVVSRGVAGGMVEFTVRVDGVTMYNQRADGVILATPTGSTAYALSANGPILHPSLAGLTLVPVAPQTLSNRPIALPDDCSIEIEITDVRDGSAHFDMQTFSQLAPGDIVRAGRSRDVATLLHPLGYNFFETLRHKLHWNVMPPDSRRRS